MSACLNECHYLIDICINEQLNMCMKNYVVRAYFIVVHIKVFLNRLSIIIIIIVIIVIVIVRRHAASLLRTAGMTMKNVSYHTEAGMSNWHHKCNVAAVSQMTPTSHPSPLCFLFSPK